MHFVHICIYACTLTYKKHVDIRTTHLHPKSHVYALGENLRNEEFDKMVFTRDGVVKYAKQCENGPIQTDGVGTHIFISILLNSHEIVKSVKEFSNRRFASSLLPTHADLPH